MDFLSDEVQFEQVLMQSKETFVYKVPPLATSSGHRAETFGLENPLFTGLLKVIQSDVKLRISLYRYKDETTLLTTPENTVLFGECPIEVEPKGDITPFVDSVVDSSRYFVIRLKDPASSRSVSIGIGFRERETAFDFKSALNEYVRYVDRMSTANEMSKEQAELFGDEDNEVDKGPVKQMKDMSLKEGEKIHIKTSGKRQNKTRPSGGGGLLSLKPPPPAGSMVHAKTPQELAETSQKNEDNSNSGNGGGNEDWGNMTGATNVANSSSTDKNGNDDDEWGDFASFS